MYSRFPCPTGSLTRRRFFLSVDRNAYRFPTSTPPNPQSFANPMQRLIVGSSLSESAVLGLSIIKRTSGLQGFQTRLSAYRYLPHGEIIADFFTSPPHSFRLSEIRSKPLHPADCRRDAFLSLHYHLLIRGEIYKNHDVGLLLLNHRACLQ